MINAKQILLIEDNKHDQFFFKQALLKIESAVLFDIAGNGKEAIDKLTSSPSLPDLIFTDINMPVMDGIEFVSEVIKIPYIKDIPIVVLSGDTSQMDKLSQMGVKAFIEKPADCKILQKLVEFVLDMRFMKAGNPANYGDFQFILANLN